MVPPTDGDGGGGGGGDDPADPAPSFVYCRECGAKASVDWSFCRTCERSLEDPIPPDEGPVGANDAGPAAVAGPSGRAEGCPKCGHTDAEVDDIATTGVGLSRLVDVQNRRFTAVSCTRCGYTEFYKGRKPDEIVDLFIG
jgi:hypothetical protein